MLGPTLLGLGLMFVLLRLLFCRRPAAEVAEVAEAGPRVADTCVEDSRVTHVSSLDIAGNTLSMNSTNIILNSQTLKYSPKTYTNRTERKMKSVFFS